MKRKNIIIIIEFLLIIFSFFIINAIKKDDLVSSSERRKLAQFPEITAKSIFNGKAANEFEKYAMDQFVERDLFRKIKYYFSSNVIRQKDVNKLFVLDDGIYKIEYPLQEQNVKKTAQTIQNITKTYLEDMNIYYSIIPDKNYYLSDEYLKLDYSKMKEIIAEELTEAHYIDIFSELSLGDFYKTDLHWKQENLGKVVKKIEEEMKLESNNNVKYERKEIGNFYGAYYGQAGVNVAPDKIICLTNKTISECTTNNIESKKTSKVYDLDKYAKSMDKYDIYLSGATPIITINNPNSETSKELLLFRDSFGSSIAPLLLSNYSKITLIDTRYIDSRILGEYVDFKNQDVLFLYNVMILNQNIIR